MFQFIPDGEILGSVSVRRSEFHRIVAGITLAVLVIISTFLVGSTQATASSRYRVDTNGTALEVRKGPGLDWPVVGSVTDGARVMILCTFRRGGQLWDNVGRGRYVADKYVKTGTDRPVARKCDLPTAGVPPMTDAARPVPTTQMVRFEIDENSCAARRAGAGRLVPWFKYSGPWVEWWKGPLLKGACKVEDLVEEYVYPAVAGCVSGAVYAQVKNAILTKTPAGIPSTAYSCITTGLKAIGIKVIAVNAPVLGKE